MMRKTVRFVAFAACVLALHGAARAAAVIESGAQAGAPITAAQAAPFLGEWILTLQGPNGPGTFALSVNAEKEKVAADITSEAMPKQAIGTISLANKSLVLGYSFTWEGNPVEAVVTLTPAEDGKTAAQIDFAGGAYVMTGTATKKEKGK